MKLMNTFGKAMAALAVAGLTIVPIAVIAGTIAVTTVTIAGTIADMSGVTAMTIAAAIIRRAMRIARPSGIIMRLRRATAPM
jgi:hypothetical protein